MRLQLYVVGLIRLPADGNTPESPCFGIFSEQTPTIMGNGIMFTHLTVDEDSYEDASFIAEWLMDSDARFVRTSYGSRPSWGVATVEEFRERIKARIEAEKVTS